MSDLFLQVRAIKAISLWQPWAWLIARGLKADETRSWPTSHRGPLAIHASKTLDIVGAPEALCIAAGGPNWRDECDLGAVIAIVDQVDCQSTLSVARSGISRANREAGNYGPGRYAHRYANIRPLAEPIPVIGRQGLFNWAPPQDLEARLLDPIDHIAACRKIGWL